MKDQNAPLEKLSFGTWFFNPVVLQHAFGENGNEDAFMAALSRDALDAGWRSEYFLTSKLLKRKLKRVRVEFNSIGETTNHSGVVVRFQCTITGRYVAILRVVKDASGLLVEKLPQFIDTPLDREMKSVVMAWGNGKWSALVHPNSMIQTGDPFSADFSSCIALISEAYSNQLGILGSRRGDKTYGLWRVSGVWQKKPVRYYVICSAIPVIRNNGLSFNTPFLWLGSNEIYAMNKRPVDVDSVTNLELLTWETTQLDLESIANLIPILAFENAFIKADSHFVSQPIYNKL